MHPDSEKLNQIKLLQQSQPWFNTLINSFSGSHIKSSDSINLWGIPSNGVTQSISKLPNLKTIIDIIEFIHLDTSLLPITNIQEFYTVLQYSLSKKYPEININKGDSAILDTTQFIKKITRHNQKLCIIIDTMDDLTELPPQFLNSIIALRSSFIGKICFVFVSHHPLYEHSYYSNFPKFLDISIHKEIVAEVFIKNFKYPKDLDLQNKFSKEIKTYAMTLAGGCSGLYSKIIRNLDQNKHYKDINKSSLDKLIEDPSIQTRLKRIFNSLYENEKQYIYNLSNNKKDSNKSSASNYILKSGIYKNNKIQMQLLDYWLKISSKNKPKPESIIRNRFSKIKVDLNSGYIYQKESRQKEILSETELKIIKLFLNSNNAIVTKDQIAKVIWEKETSDKYSEWAIVKKISRIRKKLNDKQRPYRFITTIKGRGFRIQNVKEYRQ